jgi:hypothetical protein
MKSIIRKVLFFSSLALLAYIFFYFGKNVSYKEQSSLFDNLRTTSGIIFTIMGIWIAVIYPNSLLKVFSQEITTEEDMQHIEKIYNLIMPMVYSAIIFSVVLIIQMIYPLAKQISFFNSNISTFRGLLYSFIGILNILQIWTLFIALIPGNNLVKELRYFSKTKNYHKKFYASNSRR